MKTKEEIEQLANELAVNNAYKWFEYPKNIPPIHSENYLIFVDGYIEIDLFRGDHNKFNSELYNKNCNITHWMSLPNKPLNNKNNMKLRIMQIILFFPCCLLDLMSLLVIHVPMWVVCGKGMIEDRDPLLQWLFEKTDK